MAMYSEADADLTSSEMSSEINGVGMGRRVGPSPRTLGDFLPSQLSHPTRKKTREGEENSNSRKKTSEVKEKETEVKEKSEETPTGPVWTCVIQDPLSPAVIVGSWSNSYPYFGLVTRLKSFEDFGDPVVKNLKFSGCNKLVSLNQETFAASFYSGSIVLWDYNLTESKVTFFRHHGEVSGLEGSHDGKYLLSSGRDRKISLIDVSAGVLKDEIREGHFDGIHDLSPSPDDANCLLTCGHDGAISLWDWRMNENRREAASTEVTLTPTSIYWSRVDPNLFYVGTCQGSVASFDVRNIRLDHMAREISPGHRVTRIKPVKKDKVVIVSETDRFEILEELSLFTSFSSPPSQGTVKDVVQVDESTIYSVSSVPGFTKHNLVNSNNQTQTDRTSGRTSDDRTSGRTSDDRTSEDEFD